MNFSLYFTNDERQIGIENAYNELGETMDDWHYPIYIKTPLPIGSAIFLDNIKTNENPFSFTVTEILVFIQSEGNECWLCVKPNIYNAGLEESKGYVKHLQTQWLRGNESVKWFNFETILKLVFYRWPKIGKILFRIFK